MLHVARTKGNGRQEMIDVCRPLAVVELSFVFKKKVKYGFGLYIVGNIPELGAWNPLHAVKLFWSEGDNWRQTITLELPQSSMTKIEYKYIVTEFNRINLKDMAWEAGPNRVAEIEGFDNKAALVSSPTTPVAASHLGCKGYASPPHNFVKKNKPGQVELGRQIPAAYSLDCLGLAPARLRDSLEQKANSDFLLLQNIRVADLRTLLPVLPQYMAYFEDEDRNETCAILFNLMKWRLTTGDLFRTDEHNQVIWAEFSSTSTKERLLIANAQTSSLADDQTIRLDSFLKSIRCSADYNSSDVRSYTAACDTPMQDQRSEYTVYRILSC